MASIEIVLFFKAFKCGLCGAQWVMTSGEPIEKTPPCPKCEAVTSGTIEIDIHATD